MRTRARGNNGWASTLRPPRRKGFSLLEVMVSVAIFGLVFTVILSAQGGLAASNKVAGNLGMALTLARCKMTEQEERLLKNGYPEIDQVDTDVSCCEDSDVTGFRCDTRIEKVELPNPPSNTLGDGGASLLTGGGGDAGIMGALGGLGDKLGTPGSSPLSLGSDGGVSLQGLGSMVTDQVGLGASGPGAGAEGLLSMAMGFVYPSLKPILEASIRRVTVTVNWKEGPNARKFSVVQYVTNPQRGGLLSEALPVPSGLNTGGTVPSPTPGRTTGP